ncbi:hypothetical protein PR001_g3826 [Phytophthora rubi]|uniref:Uncharacterized protein n=2 Tax=Phytophthora rubi TaxID=129364 RepID=A0A6A3NUZ5_9STRA|nr:hypothetical protein PR001_g3826 [Phytophthora rubi]
MELLQMKDKGPKSHHKSLSLPEELTVLRDSGDWIHPTLAVWRRDEHISYVHAVEHALYRGLHRDAAGREQESNTLLKSIASKRVSLPALQVQPVCVHTTPTFMEEFCEHVLDQFASDLEEVLPFELTMAICAYVVCHIGDKYGVQLVLLNYVDANTLFFVLAQCDLDGTNGRCGAVAGGRHGRQQGQRCRVTPLFAAARNVAACSKFPMHTDIISLNTKVVSLLVERRADVDVMSDKKNLIIFGYVETELSLRQFLEDRGHEFVVTSNKDGDHSEFAEQLHGGGVVISQPFWSAYITL